MAIATFQAIRVLGGAIASFVVALMITPLVTNIIMRLQMKKQIRTSESAPIFARLHKDKAGTPTGGGIIIWGTVAIVAGFFGLMKGLDFIDRAQTYLPLAAFFAAALVGLADDVMGIMKVGPKGGGISVRQKLAIYFAMSLVGACWFYWRLDFTSLTVPFWGTVDMGGWYVPFFMFIVIASAFSVNETDGLDGLAGGVMLFSFAALTVIAFALGRYHLATFNATVAGALLAFLWFNIYPARFFMGDTGSMALGITLGVTAMLTNTALFLPFFALIPIIETLSVIVQLTSKKLRGKKIFHSTPIHHHFEAIGWPESQITMRFWIVSAVASIIGLVVFSLNLVFMKSGLF